MIINNDFETKLAKQNFFREEVRDGYYISSEMKKIWAVQLDILREFISVCAENNIEYFLEGGTLLGAVRHGGYIPWDDDIDICMTREQYNKLLLCGEKAFMYPYLFQSPIDSSSYNRNHVQIRNITTTAILKKEYKRFDFNQGIFIDIFVLDQCPKNRYVLGKYMWFQLRYNLFRRLKYNMFYDNHKFLQFLAKWVSYAIPYKVVNPHVYEQKSGQYYGTKANSWVDFYCFSEGKYKKLRYFEPDWFGGYTTMKFEMLTVKVPCQYDNILRQMYGNNYKIPIHEDTYHGEILFDVNTAFEDYILDK